MKEHDVVISTQNFDSVPAGSRGTITYIYDAEVAYEVEFIIENRSYFRLVAPNQIKLAEEENKN